MDDQNTSVALALMPFSKNFADVFQSMNNACVRYTESAGSFLKGHASTASRAHVRCDRIDLHTGTFDIVQRLIESIRNATFCIVDITGNNNNVLWELGFAMALEKPVVILTQDRQSVGFDLQHMRNIQYSREQLKTTLEDPLIEEIKAIMRELPDPSAFPTHSSHAQALAISSASPTYFLDAEYKIQYMNEAAATLFATNELWRGRQLADFINTFADRLVNLPAIEKNLQVQTELIEKLEKAGRSTDICPYNIEPVILDSKDFGRLDLQKTGVAVRDPANGRIIGWVVSFNVVNATEPDKFAKFHEIHKYAIQHKLYVYHGIEPGGGVQQPQSDMEPSDVVQKWIAAGEARASYKRASGYAEKQRCFEFAKAVMKTPRYGLSSVEYLPEWFFDYKKAEYLMMSPSGGTPERDLVGVFRLHPNHDLLQYSNLEVWVKDLAKQGEMFADVGAYLHPALSDKARRAQCLAALLGPATALCQEIGNIYMYAQVPTDSLPRYKKFMFTRAGSEFFVKGWEHQWVPIVLNCIAFDPSTSKSDSPLVVESNEIDRDFVDRAIRSRVEVQRMDDWPMLAGP